MKRIVAVLSGLVVLLVLALAIMASRTRRPPAENGAGAMGERALVVQASPGQSLPQKVAGTLDDNSRRIQEYQIGRQLGSCLVRGCSVLVGKVRVVGDPEREAGEEESRAVVYRKLEIETEEWLWGARQGSTSQVVNHASRPTLTKTAIGPWSAWEGAELKIGERLLVAFWGHQAQRATWRSKQEEIAVAVTGESLISKIRENLALHDRLLRSAGELSQIPRLLREKPDGLTAGYSLSYLIEAASVRDLNGAAVIIGSLQTNDKLPDTARVDAINQLLIYFNQLSPSARRSVAESLVETASSDSVNLAEFAVSILVRLSDERELNQIPLRNAEQRQKLVSTYRRALDKGLIEKGHAAFESQIGLR